jgi:pilus assembly protein CpaF
LIFSVIISEKGGAERRESFDRTEINVGRVQGNELTLPKGNVSKRHARLLFRDGRFIVTDLKSTNGTYVNGRKIQQATIVREGDKIYIGDFVIRIEFGASASGSGGGLPALPPHEDSGVQGDSQPVNASELESSSAERSLAKGISPRIENKSAPEPAGRASDVISHFPLEQDPDEAPAFNVPGPPRVPSSQAPQARGGSRPTNPAPPMQQSGHGSTPPPQAPLTPPPPPPAGMQPPPMTLAGAGMPPVPMAPPPMQAPPMAPPPMQPVPMQPLQMPGPVAHVAAPVAAPVAPPAMVAPVSIPRPQPQVQAQGPNPASVYPPPGDRITTPSMGVGPNEQRTDIPRPAAVDVRSVQAAMSPQAAAQAGYGPPNQSPQPSQGAASSSAASSARKAMPPTSERVDAPRAAKVNAHRAALATLIDRALTGMDARRLDTPDDAFIGQLTRVLTERAAAMRGANELPQELEVAGLISEARRELFDLGPLAALLEDEDISEVHVMRHDYVVAMQGRRQMPTDVAFTSEASAMRALRRLCLASGRPLQEGERFVERRLSRARLFAVVPHVADQGLMIILRKPQRADLSLEDLVRSGTISRAMAGLLQQCVAARANILVTGAIGAGATSLIGALAGAGSTEDRVIVLQEDDEIIFNQPHTISILLGETPEENERAVQAAARAHPDRLVVGAFAGRVAAEVVDAMGDGVDGVLAASRAPTLRQATARLSADLAATRVGISVETAREWLASAFDLVIEIARLRDGRHRVLRVGELTTEGGGLSVRDIFTFALERTAAGGALEGTFHPTGHVPGLVEDLAARGIHVDPALFRRG